MAVANFSDFPEVGQWGILATISWFAKRTAVPRCLQLDKAQLWGARRSYFVKAQL